jgi:hypothetical protein
LPSGAWQTILSWAPHLRCRITKLAKAVAPSGGGNYFGCPAMPLTDFVAANHIPAMLELPRNSRR